MIFHEKFREWVREHSLSTEGAAQVLGVRLKTVEGWKNNGSYPRLDIFKRICERTGISPEALLDYTPEAPEAITKRVDEANGKFGSTELSHATKVKIVEFLGSAKVVARRLKIRVIDVQRVRKEYRRRGKL